MTEKEKQILRLELLHASNFREVLGRCYVMGVELFLRHMLHTNPEEHECFRAGDFNVNLAALQSSLFSLHGIPQHVKNILSDMCVSAITETAILHVFHLMELDNRETPEEIPASIDYVLNRLNLPENKAKINTLHGNAEKNLVSLKAELENLWNEYGNPAKILRNDIAHGRLSMFASDSEGGPRKRDREEIEEAAIKLSQAVDGIYKILNRISQTCFGVKDNLPTCWDFWNNFWSAGSSPSNEIWCFDFAIYPWSAE